MAAVPFVIPALTTDAGIPVSGALISFKKKGTSTNQAAYLDANLTTLDGDLGTENSYHVVVAANCRLDGFTITNGYASDDGAGAGGRGAGCSSSPSSSSLPSSSPSAGAYGGDSGMTVS